MHAVAECHVIRRPRAERAEPDGLEQTILGELDELGPTQGPDRVLIGQIPGATGTYDVHTPASRQVMLERSARHRSTHLHLDGTRRAYSPPAQRRLVHTTIAVLPVAHSG